MLRSGMQKARHIKRRSRIGTGLLSFGSGHCSQELLPTEPVFLQRHAKAKGINRLSRVGGGHCSEEASSSQPVCLVVQC